MRKEQPLTAWVHGEEAADHHSCTRRCAAVAGPAIAIEGVQAVVDGYLLTCGDGAPSEHLHTMAHRTRLTGVVEIAAGRPKYGKAVEPQLTKVFPLPVGEVLDVGFLQDADMTSAEDELVLCEGSPSENAQTLGTRLADLDVTNHAFNVGSNPATTLPITPKTTA